MLLQYTAPSGLEEAASAASAPPTPTAPPAAPARAPASPAPLGPSGQILMFLTGEIEPPPAEPTESDLRVARMERANAGLALAGFLIGAAAGALLVLRCAAPRVKGTQKSRTPKTEPERAPEPTPEES